MRLGGGRVDSVNDSEGLKSLFPAWTPETRPRAMDGDLAGFSDFNRTEFYTVSARNLGATVVLLPQRQFFP
ncbi:hypothetical protein [Thermincola ferriacetica]|uniref:hypothetical protein n=1 Tax=Thermincola ferriacetica TaxID=281456 RepID=UPI00128E4AD6|nr:hypothetical protein [Thermincola ferriacetica]